MAHRWDGSTGSRLARLIVEGVLSYPFIVLKAMGEQIQDRLAILKTTIPTRIFLCLGISPR
jgi:hypothetical protein